jgi:hypothetical protein
VKRHFKEDPALWSKVRRVLDDLGPRGMSSDETETEAGPTEYKRVRRVAKVWIQKEVTDMWNGVEDTGRMGEASRIYQHVRQTNSPASNQPLRQPLVGLSPYKVQASSEKSCDA